MSWFSLQTYKGIHIIKKHNVLSTYVDCVVRRFLLDYSAMLHVSSLWLFLLPNPPISSHSLQMFFLLNFQILSNFQTLTESILQCFYVGDCMLVRVSVCLCMSVWVCNIYNCTVSYKNNFPLCCIYLTLCWTSIHLDPGCLIPKH